MFQAPIDTQKNALKTKALESEYILSNHAGAWSYSTLVGCNTKKQHGLFIYRIPHFNNQPFLLLSSLNESILKDGKTMQLRIQPKQWNTHKYNGLKFISGGSSQKVNTTVFRIGDDLFQKELLFVEGENRLLLKYSYLNGKSPATLQFSPLLAYRKIDEVTYANAYCNTLHGEPQNGVSFKMYADFPSVQIQCSNPVEYAHHPTWEKGFQYDENTSIEIEDLYNPGILATTLHPGKSVIVQVSLSATDTRTLQSNFQNLKNKMVECKSAKSYLQQTARQFMASHEKQYYLMSQLPFQLASATEVFKALPGLKIALKDCHTCVSAEHNLMVELKRRLENKKRHRLTLGFDDPQVFLWACWSFLTLKKKDEPTFNHYLDIVVQIIQAVRNHKIHGIKLSKNGLIKIRKTSEKEADKTPKLKERRRYLVEINAIWYNALVQAKNYVEDASLQQKLELLATQVKASFVQKFWDEKRACLLDFVDKKIIGTEIRSHMLFAISQQHSPLSKSQQKAVYDCITRHLFTAKGVRSLSPENSFYVSGNIKTEANIPLNGPVETWLLGSYVDATLRIFGKEGFPIANDIKNRMKQISFLKKGVLPGFYTGNPPYLPLQNTANLLATAETMRLFETVKTCKQHLSKNTNECTFEYLLFGPSFSA